MITQALCYGREQSAAAIAGRGKIERGAPERPLSPQDLLEFGRCPWRWHNAGDPEDFLAAEGPSLLEWMALDPGHMDRYFVRRPDTYESMRLECPKCGSEGPAKSCTKCGQRRKNVVRPRPWTSAAKPCAAWIEQHEIANHRIVSPKDWDRAKAATDNLIADNPILNLLPGADRLRTLEGTWHDDATALDLPLWSRVSLSPASESARVNALVQIVDTTNADPSVWEANAFRSGAHIRAALTLALWNACGLADVREFLWIVVERDAPFLTARRRASQELLNEGRTRMAELLAAYAACLKADHWPSFDNPATDDLNAWSMVSVQPWFTAGAGPHGGYFAPTVAGLSHH